MVMGASLDKTVFFGLKNKEKTHKKAFSKLSLPYFSLSDLDLLTGGDEKFVSENDIPRIKMMTDKEHLTYVPHEQR